LSMGSEFQTPGSKTSETVGRQYQTSGGDKKGWHKPLPESLPKPGYWPMFMGLGITFILWSLAVGFNEVVSTIIILAFIGLILFVISLVGWIGDLRDERRDQNE